jgi:hypothetical protein
LLTTNTLKTLKAQIPKRSFVDVAIEAKAIQPLMILPGAFLILKHLRDEANDAADELISEMLLISKNTK